MVTCVILNNKKSPSCLLPKREIEILSSKTIFPLPLKDQQPATKFVKHLNKTVLVFLDAAITSRGKAVPQSLTLRRWEPGA